VGIVLVALVALFHGLLDPKCTSLILLSGGEAKIALPEQCEEIAQSPQDSIVAQQYEEQSRRGLIFKNWISCKGTLAAPKTELPFE